MNILNFADQVIEQTPYLEDDDLKSYAGGLMNHFVWICAMLAQEAFTAFLDMKFVELDTARIHVAAAQHTEMKKRGMTQ